VAMISRIGKIAFIRILTSLSTFYVSLSLLALLPEDEAAIYALSLSLFAFYGLIIASPLGQVVQAHYCFKSGGLFGAAYGQYVSIIIVTSSLIFLVLFWATNANLFQSGVIALFMITSNMLSLFLNAMNLQKDETRFTILSLWVVFSNLALGAHLGTRGQISVGEFFSLLCLMQIIPVLYTLKYSFKAYISQRDRVFLLRKKYLSIALIASGLLYFCNHYFRLAIPLVFGLEEFGKYAAMLVIMGQAFNSLEVFISQVFDPHILNHESDRGARVIFYQKLLAIIIGLPIIFIFCLLVERNILNTEVQLSKIYIFLLSCFFLLKCLNFSFMSFFLLKNKKSRAFKTSVVGSVFIFLLYIWGGSMGSITSFFIIPASLMGLWLIYNLARDNLSWQSA
jgi:O-antigen/teichoic acid export membrane protein